MKLLGALTGVTLSQHSRSIVPTGHIPVRLAASAPEGAVSSGGMNRKDELKNVATPENSIVDQVNERSGCRLARV